MLSPYEFSALLLIARAADPSELDFGDVTALVEQQLVALEQLASDHRRALLTGNGRSVLETIGRRH